MERDKNKLFEITGGLLQPTIGTIEYNGQSIFKTQYHFQQHICYVGHKIGISPLLTVQEICQFDLH